MKKTSLLLLLLLCSTFIFAQEFTVSGNIIDEGGIPIAGANIIVKGTAQGVVSDFDGNYTIKTEKGTILIFSFLGYLSQEAVANTSQIKIVLSEDVSSLNEVLVVAFGTSQKRALTGAVESIKTDAITKQPQVNLTNSLQGLAPGLQVLEGNGQPGNGAAFLIRGIGSASASNNPLIVVDGAIFNGEISQINPNDVESVNVLKDASSASIYGSKAANGVVLITTKIGKNKKTTYTVNTEVGFTNNANPNDFRVMDASEYVEYYREAAVNSGNNPDDSSSGFYLPINQQYNTNWVDEVFKTGVFKKYDFSAAGGNEKTSFFTSLGYTDQEGTIVATDFERITGTLNLKHKSNEKFDYGAKMQMTYKNNNNLISDVGRSGQLSGAFQTAPIEPIFVDSAYNFDIPSNAQHNPVATGVLNNNTSEIYSVNTNLNLGYNFTPEIRAEALANFYYFSTIAKEQVGKSYLAETDGGNSFEERISGNTFNIINTLAFNKKINDNHEIEVKVGMEATRRRSSSLSVSTTNFLFGNLNDVGEGTGLIANDDINSSFDGVSTAGFFGRVKYDFKNKLFIDGSIRRDGASNFGVNTRWGSFWASGLSYVISDDLFKDSDIIDNLKIRASYGTSGNNSIGNFEWRDLYTTGINYLLSPSEIYSGVGVSGAFNPNLQWEKNKQLDVGIDFGLFNNRLSGSFDYFKRNSLDLLYPSPLSLSTGFTSQTINSTAELLNTGFEVSLTAYLLKSASFSWKADANFSFYKQEFVEVPEEIDFGNSIWKLGERSDNWYYQRYAGVDPATGDALYLDIDGNSSTSYNGSEDRVIVGQATPDTYGSVTNTFIYKDISLSFMFYYSSGSEDYFSLGQALSTDGQGFPANQWSDVLNRWQQPGDITDVPRAQINNPSGNLASTRYLYDNSFVRLQNVSLGYTLPKSTADLIGMDRISLRVSGQNLWTFTDYPGYDPTSESYPLPRTITIGANLSF